ncbi:MAG: hypothetical protein L0332_22230 [Chloroflexi bacterium]|nr:hypothetical protein [Chloroflexota bacterium]MCI0576512.1 hypothetical protein [Chloroflexota bacterium]MCI0650234.1 hypothetical protein [Chloroflexota bacterium]MCI0729412.1 hypothetical protein [Chloroflexota bacterium]
MSRIININSPGKVRNQNQRTIAEILRHISKKSTMDQEAKDMAAALVFLLREIYTVADQSAKAWEKRGYWMKADRFLREWEWTGEMATNFEDVIRNEAWDLLPRLLAELLPRFAGMQIKSFTRPPSTWQGAYQKLLSQPPGALPY